MRVRLFGAFTKTERQDDGTLKVSGIASSEAVDSAGDVVTAAAMKAALPDYMRFGAVREMHGNVAAGTAISANVQADGKTAFEALVVDPVSVKKVETGVLKGFSIGGRIPANGRNKDNPKQIERLSLTEISLVDRPANPDAVISLVKFDEGEPLKKGLYQLSWASDLLSSLDCLQRDTEWEKQFEGDSSAIPARLKALVKELAEIVIALCAEEVSELTAADAAGGLAVMTDKELAEIVTKTTAALGPMVEAAVTKAMKVKGSEGEPVGDPPPEKPVAKADKPAVKITLDESGEKITKLETDLAAEKKRADDAVKKAADLEAAAQTKGALKVVEKASDLATGTSKDTDPEEAKTAADSIRAIHKRGPVPFHGPVIRG